MFEEADVQKIVPNLWFDAEAETAARRYVELVPGSEIRSIVRYPEAGKEVHGKTPGSVMTVDFRLGDTALLALNGGPIFSFTPASSLFVVLEEAAAVQSLWDGLIDGGTALMPLEAYDWSEKYGWLTDRWGLNWQIGLGKHADVGRTVTPALLFGGAMAGKAEEALGFYTAVFGGSVDGIHRHDGSGKDAAGTVAHAQFRIGGQALMAMDSVESQAVFTEAFSLIVKCEDQAEIDRLWTALSVAPEAEACGWLKDRFGVSWQITPRALEAMMTSGDRGAIERLMAAFMPMKKLDLATLERAFAGETVPS
jgi:predicted 3-demethylubiquinone-9 3-methyltransferase (glyoxalase superfamily)